MGPGGAEEMQVAHTTHARLPQKHASQCHRQTMVLMPLLWRRCNSKPWHLAAASADIYELRQRAKEAIKQRWDKRVDTVKMFVGPLIGLGMTLLTL